MKANGGERGRRSALPCPPHPDTARAARAACAGARGRRARGVTPRRLRIPPPRAGAPPPPTRPIEPAREFGCRNGRRSHRRRRDGCPLAGHLRRAAIRGCEVREAWHSRWRGTDPKAGTARAATRRLSPEILRGILAAPCPLSSRRLEGPTSKGQSILIGTIKCSDPLMSRV